MMESDEGQVACNIIERIASGENVDEIQITIISEENDVEPVGQLLAGQNDGDPITVASIDGGTPASPSHIQILENVPLAASSSDVASSPFEEGRLLRKRARTSNASPTQGTKRYRGEWELIPEYEEWLMESVMEGFAFCMVCECDIDISSGKTALSGHATSNKHQKNMKATKKGTASTPSPEAPETPSSISKDKPARLGKAQRVSQTMQAEAQIMAFIVENNLPISLVDRLVAMIKSFPSVGPALRSMHLGKQKATNMVRQGFAPFFQDILVEKLKTTLFSVVVDEAIDTSKKTKLLAVFVCFANKDLKVEVDLLEFMETDGTSTQAYKILKESLHRVQQAGVNLKNWIGVRSDFSLARNESPSIFDMIKEEFPWVVVATCPILIARQSVSIACEAFPERLEEGLRQIHDNLSSTPKQQQSSLPFQELSRLDVEKLLTHGQVKWLSIRTLVKLILEKWSDFPVHFTNAIMTDSATQHGKVLELLLSPTMKIMLLFLEYVLSIVDDYCETFRSGGPVFYNLERETGDLIRTLAKSFMTRESVVDDPMQLNADEEMHYLPLDQIYLGHEAATTLRTHMEQNQVDANDPDVLLVLTTAQIFYKKLIIQIQSSMDFSGQMFKFVNLINPMKAYNTDPPSLMEFFSNFGHPDWPRRAMEEEWRSLCLLDLPCEDLLQSPLAFWTHVFSCKTPTGTIRFKHIHWLVMFFMSLPYAGEVSTKIFTLMKDVRANSRKYLKTVTLSACLRSHCGLRRVPDALNNPHLNQRLQKVKSNAKSGDCDDIPILLANSK